MNTGTPPPRRTNDARPGTARAALGYRDFRIIFFGLLASNVGTWMQNLALPAYVDSRTHSATWVAAIGFAQLGPILLLSIPAGVLGDKLPRRQWLITTQMIQLVLALVLAVLIARDANLWAIFSAQLGIGIGSALGGPVMQSSIPLLVSRADLPGALSLNSVMLNGARVVGPALAAVMIAAGLTVSGIFVFNAATYLFAIVAIAIITLPHVVDSGTEQGLAKLFSGVRIARQRSVLSRILLSMTAFSFLCLPYIGLFPTVARLNFGIDSAGSTYKWMFAIWALGGCIGGLSTGVLSLRIDRRRLLVYGYVGFAAVMLAFTFASGPAAALPIAFMLGFFYFVIATAMATIFQINMHDHERSRVMSLWMMSFGGTVPIGTGEFRRIHSRVA
ncbi:MAG TPA: MFS transporter, partial [Ilumatobacteraceae bacterium]|nr:MFS transporter [Ilumatobacteraceae bacterium]